MNGFRRLDIAFGRVYGVIGALVGISIGLFAVAISLDLILRLLGWGNLPGMQEIVEYVLYIGVFLAAPWVLRLNAHIRVDLLVGALPDGARVAVERALDLAGIVICALLFWYGLRNLLSAKAVGAMQYDYYEVAEWFLLLFFVAGFVLLGIEFLFRMIRAGTAPEAADSEEAGF
ncbi:MAG: TRAP transporter small permease [Sneathiellaceae bacterium]